MKGISNRQSCEACLVSNYNNTSTLDRVAYLVCAVALALLIAGGATHAISQISYGASVAMMGLGAVALFVIALLQIKKRCYQENITVKTAPEPHLKGLSQEKQAHNDTYIATYKERFYFLCGTLKENAPTHLAQGYRANNPKLLPNMLKDRADRGNAAKAHFNAEEVASMEREAGLSIAYELRLSMAEFTNLKQIVNALQGFAETHL